MNEGTVAAMRRLLDRLYPERQIILRSRSDVSFVTLGKKSQIGLTLMAIILFGWLSYASVGMYRHAEVVATKNDRIAKILGVHDRLNADMRAVESRYRQITANLEDNQRLLSDVLEQRTELDKVRQKLLLELSQTRVQRDVARNHSQKLQSRLAKLENSLRHTLAQSNDLQSNLSRVTNRLANTMSEREQAHQERKALAIDLNSMREHVLGLRKARNDLQLNLREVAKRLASTESDRDRAQRERTALAANLNNMQQDLLGLRKARQDLQTDLQTSEQMVAQLTDQRNEAFSTNQALNKRIAELEGRLGSLQTAQRTLVQSIRDRTDANITELETVVQLTGLKLDDLLERVDRRQAGIGGPLLAAEEDKHHAGEWSLKQVSPLYTSLGVLESRLTRWTALNRVLERLPITPPVDNFSISSAFGKRRDPFTKRRAFHAGIDLSGVKRTSVYVTSPGVVTYVGWKGPYGRFIEVDHGLGLRTRYGHLHKILVKKGQKVNFRHKIGLMGSSGRSTGTHVHYEVVFDGKPVNPMKFLKAGKYVFKG